MLYMKTSVYSDYSHAVSLYNLNHLRILHCVVGQLEVFKITQHVQRVHETVARANGIDLICNLSPIS